MGWKGWLCYALEARGAQSFMSVGLRCNYHRDYYLALPPAHPFPMSKYPLLFEKLLSSALLEPADVETPGEVATEDLALVHTRDYLEALTHGTLAPAAQRRLGLPWSERLWRRSRLAVQGTLNAARTAFEHGLAGNLAGGTHHAFADHGEGFCALNDTAVAIRVLQRDRRIRRALVVDLDVHQGNGTAAIFAGDESVFTFSMHGERNFPATKMRSAIDVGLADGIGDDDYLAELDRHLPAILQSFDADIVFYLAGVDVVQGDRYGRLKLTDDGLRRRERAVIELVAAHRRKPLVITIAGGYAATAERTAALHAIVFEEAARYLAMRGSR